MAIYIYYKKTENINIFSDLISMFKKENQDMYVTIEHKRNFSKLDNIKSNMNLEDILLVSSLSSLGVSNIDIANQLYYFIKSKKCLVIVEAESTYKFGISQPTNQAVLNTILNSTISSSKLIEMVKHSKSNAGRNKMEFPDNWEKLYDDWERKKITSKEFMDKSGLKKATFYNMITEYRELLKANEEFLKKYKIG